jgi:hypothetical protein
VMSRGRDHGRLFVANPVRIVFFCVWTPVIVTGGLAALAMLVDDVPGVMTKHIVDILLDGCGATALGLIVWGILFGKKEQNLVQLGLVTISAILLALVVGFGKMIR